MDFSSPLIALSSFALSFFFHFPVSYFHSLCFFPPSPRRNEPRASNLLLIVCNNLFPALFSFGPPPLQPFFPDTAFFQRALNSLSILSITSPFSPLKYLSVPILSFLNPRCGESPFFLIPWECPACLGISPRTGVFPPLDCDFLAISPPFSQPTLVVRGRLGGGSLLSPLRRGGLSVSGSRRIFLMEEPSWWNMPPGIEHLPCLASLPSLGRPKKIEIGSSNTFPEGLRGKFNRRVAVRGGKKQKDYSPLFPPFWSLPPLFKVAATPPQTFEKSSLNFVRDYVV